MSKRINNYFSAKGKVVDKPEVLDRLITFQFYQSETNMSLTVFYEMERNPNVQMGQEIKVEGSLLYDSEDDILYLHAFDVFGGSKPRTSTPIKFGREDISQQKQNTSNIIGEKTFVSEQEISTNAVEEVVPEDVTIKDVVSESKEEEVIPVTEENTKESEVVEVGLPPLQSEKEDIVKEEGTEKDVAFKRLFNVTKEVSSNTDVSKEIVEEGKESPSINNSSPKQKEQKTPQEESVTRFSVSDFDC